MLSIILIFLFFSWPLFSLSVLHKVCVWTEFEVFVVKGAVSCNHNVILCNQKHGLMNLS